MAYRRFTDEDVATVVAQYKAHVSRRDIARALGVKVRRINLVLREQGFSPQKERNRLSPEEEAEVVQRYLAGETSPALGRAYGCDGMTIRNIVRRGGHKTRPVTAPRPKPFTDDEVVTIGTYAAAGLSVARIGQLLHRSPQRVKVLMREQGITPLCEGRPHGSAHPFWKGGRQIHDGYVSVLVARDDPMVGMADPNGYVREHRLVMARAIGRPLLRTETVHHIDGNRAHNELSNLQLRRGKHGKHQAFRCCDCGSYNVVAVDLATGQPVH